uniref:Uncharacterized protein n=1 Tax=Sphaerodactylus townsendi TaxID=933632 RepID=A0ACB8ECF9_9SAUR
MRPTYYNQGCVYAIISLNWGKKEPHVMPDVQSRFFHKQAFILKKVLVLLLESIWAMPKEISEGRLHQTTPTPPPTGGASVPCQTPCGEEQSRIQHVNQNLASVTASADSQCATDTALVGITG